MLAKVTLQDVADKAGVHRAPGARPMRNAGAISTEVREHAQKLAGEMGCRINPLVAAPKQLRRSMRASPPAGNAARSPPSSRVARNFLPFHPPKTPAQ